MNSPTQDYHNTIRLTSTWSTTSAVDWPSVGWTYPHQDYHNTTRLTPTLSTTYAVDWSSVGWTFPHQDYHNTTRLTPTWSTTSAVDSSSVGGCLAPGGCSDIGRQQSDAAAAAGDLDWCIGCQPRPPRRRLDLVYPCIGRTVWLTDCNHG